MEVLYNKAFDKLKAYNVFHACIGAVVCALICVGGIVLVCTGVGAYLGKALIQTGINGVSHCIQAAINGKFSWGELLLESGASFVSALLFPYVESFGGKALLSTAITFIKEGISCLCTGKRFNFVKTATSALIGVITLGI